MYNQTGNLYKGVFDCLYKTVSTEGVFALYKGYLAHLARILPHTVSASRLNNYRMMVTDIRFRFWRSAWWSRASDLCAIWRTSFFRSLSALKFKNTEYRYCCWPKSELWAHRDRRFLLVRYPVILQTVFIYWEVMNLHLLFSWWLYWDSHMNKAQEAKASSILNYDISVVANVYRFLVYFVYVYVIVYTWTYMEIVLFVESFLV